MMDYVLDPFRFALARVARLWTAACAPRQEAAARLPSASAAEGIEARRRIAEGQSESGLVVDYETFRRRAFKR